MGMIDNQVEEIELEINQAKEKVALKDSLEKLIKNRDFKKVITEGYFEQEAIRLVLLKAD